MSRGTLVLLRPVITEKSMTGTNIGKYTFAVMKDATKQEIAEAVAEAFGVDVVDVNTSTVHGKTRRLGRRIGKTQDWKKAVVTIAQGQRIDRYFAEGV
ncbi:MAG: 50S ribosomal protein L23 [Chloroflexi bacterium]|nr:50S ribosomal protein L23 [Chloroflexota bacterium]